MYEESPETDNLKTRLEEAEWRLRVEDAVDAVRSKALAMQSPDDLQSVVMEIWAQVSALDIPTVEGAILMFYEDGGNIEIWDLTTMTADGIGIPSIQRTSCHIDQFRQARRNHEFWSTGHPYYVFESNAADLEQLVSELEELNYANVTDLSEALKAGTWTHMWTTGASFSRGWLNLDHVAAPAARVETVTVKMAHAFDAAYRRFEDLKTAEALVHESQIEAALERVRSRTMAMRQSGEIGHIVARILGELTLLDIILTRCTIWVSHLEEGHVTWWFANPEAESGVESYDVAINDDPIFTGHVEALRNKKSVWLYTLTSDSKRALDDYIFNHTEMSKIAQAAQEGMRAPDTVYLSSAMCEFGSLMVSSLEPLSDDNLDIIQRFGRVFQQSYTRFQDVEKAEIQARESQIEAALERVRAQAMGMQSSEDIGEATLRMFEEFPTLCPSVLRSGVAIMEDKDSFDIWLAGKGEDGKSVIIKGNIVYRGERPEADDLMDAWVDGRSHTFQESVEFLAYTRSIVYNDPHPVLIPLDPGFDQYLTSFSHQTGFIFVVAGEPMYPDRGDGNVIQRFSGVFDLAYQRYRDLAKAEADYKALLAEKALTEETLSILQSTQKKLVEQEKLASLGALTAGIAHEIKNPLNFVNNFAEVGGELMDELGDAVAAGNTVEVEALLADLRDNAAQIAKHGKRADSIVKSMMQHARGGTSDAETVDINTYLEEYIGLAWHGRRARDEDFQADVVRNFAANAGTFSIQPQEFGRVILNLLNNAFDAVKVKPDGRVTVTTVRGENAVVLSVADNGTGIPDAIREKIFEPFFTTKATGEGTGLGLSLSYDIVTKGHGGTMISGTSAEGGALFTLTLPVHS